MNSREKVDLSSKLNYKLKLLISNCSKLWISTTNLWFCNVIKNGLKIVDQFWFMKLPAWMWIKLTKKTLIWMDLKCWLWYITYFCSSLLEIDEKPKKQEKIKVTFFLFTIFAHISQSYSCTFFEIHQILQKNVKLVPKMPNWRAPVNIIGANWNHQFMSTWTWYMSFHLK